MIYPLAQLHFTLHCYPLTHPTSLCTVPTPPVNTGGSTLKRLENESNSKIDILKSRNLVRIRGTSPVGALAARGVLLSFIDNINASLTIDLAPFLVRNSNNNTTTTTTTTTTNNHDNSSSDTSDLRIDRLLESTRFLYGVELVRDHGAKHMQVTAKGITC